MAEVTSRADYGYTIDIGVPETKCFAKFNLTKEVTETFNKINNKKSDQTTAIFLEKQLKRYPLKFL